MSESPVKTRLSPLHCHSVYSTLDGASSVDDYIAWCKKHGAPGLALTDHGLQIGLLELYVKAKKAGVSPIPGCEFYVAFDKGHEFVSKRKDYAHITVWAVSEAGYRNLIKLGSMSWQDDTLPGWIKEKGKTVYKSVDKPRVLRMWGGKQQKPRITLDELFAHNEGLVIGSGCLIGLLSNSVLDGNINQAERYLARLLEVFKGRLFMEVFPHVCDHDFNRESKRFEANECTDISPDGDAQRTANLVNIALAQANNVPLLMTIDSHFTTPDMKKIQDILLSQGEEGGWTFYNSYHMMTTEEAWAFWSSVYGDDKENRLIFAEAVENNDALVEMAKGLEISDQYRQPTPDIPIEIQGQGSEADQIKATLLKWVDHHGRMRWDDDKYVDRLMMEIRVICDNGVENLGPYFLFLEKECRWAAEHSILSAPGRGSGAGSLLCYLLKITHLDPFKFDLPFERFLSQARVNRGKFPDIDWDLSNRDLLVAHLREELGDLMAQCSTVITLKVRSAIKDACSGLLGWKKNDPRLEAVTKTVENEPMGVASKDFLLGYKDADGVFHDGHLLENPVLGDFFKKYPEVQEAVMQLLGIPRSISRHASAYLISNAPISDSVPTMTISGVLCTQYNSNAAFNAVEKAGLIKFDLLRVNTLDDISSCIRMVQKKMGYRVDEVRLKFAGEEHRTTLGDLRIDQLPMPDGSILDVYDLPDDPHVFRDLSDGRTETVFQMNSPLMTGFTKRIKPKTQMDLSHIVALVRPGPLEAQVGESYNGKPLTMTEAFIHRRDGDIPIAYAHPDMEPLLKDTYGTAVYQEQLQAMFSALAGYSLEEADELREILAKKKKQELERRLPELRLRLEERGWSREQVEVFVSLCIASSAYSFNRAHSASYGAVAYMCAFLKTHFPLEWWTAVLQNAKIDDIREKGYAATLLKDGLLRLPHVNGPTDLFRLIGGQVHSPLYLIDRVGPAACQAIQKARDGGGEFSSFQDFFERADGKQVNEGVVRNLILCGAFDLIEPGRKAQDILEEYFYFKRVGSLAIGRNKTGEDLRAAVVLYKAKEAEKGLKLSVPDIFSDDLQMEIARVNALPIYRVDVHDHFASTMNKNGVVYGGAGPTMSFNNPGRTIPVFTTTARVAAAVADCDSWKGVEGAWAGFVQGSETFQYTDKKSGQKVTACKLQVTNNGEAVEVVIWPDLYSQIKEPSPDKILIAAGSFKESREPGKWSLSANWLKSI
jgi:DNA polymerase-3 subunit alpha